MNWAMFDAIGIWVVIAMLIGSTVFMVQKDRAHRQSFNAIGGNLSSQGKRLDLLKVQMCEVEAGLAMDAGTIAELLHRLDAVEAELNLNRDGLPPLGPKIHKPEPAREWRGPHV